MLNLRCSFCGDQHPAGTFVCPKTQRRLTGILTAGTVVDGKFRIEDVIGTGGMGVVYRAEAVRIGRPVALKLLLPEYVAFPELVARVEREARTAGRIDHPNVVAIVDLGGTPEYGPYIAMELLRGEELATLLERSGNRLPPDRAVDICRQVLDALEAAHAQGVVHRDLKPENVFLARIDGQHTIVKVLDFGISKVASDKNGLSSLTRTGTIMGTPQFMAPEQAAGVKSQDARVDIYACGALLYAMLTGALPYEAENYNLLISEILNKPPTPIFARDPTLDPALAAIVMRALARKPDHRYPSARAMRDELVAWAEAAGTARPGAVRAAPPVEDTTSPTVLAPAAAADESTTAGAPDEPTTATVAPPPEGDGGATEVEIGAPPPDPSLRLPHPDAPRRETFNDEAVTAPGKPSRLRNKAPTQLGWDNRPAAGAATGPAAAPARRLPRLALAVGALLLLLCGGGYALRRLRPKAWNTTVAGVGLGRLATPDRATPAPAPRPAHEPRRSTRSVARAAHHPTPTSSGATASASSGRSASGASASGGARSTSSASRGPRAARTSAAGTRRTTSSSRSTTTRSTSSRTRAASTRSGQTRRQPH